jgi:hypothetical protein
MLNQSASKGGRNHEGIVPQPIVVSQGGTPEEKSRAYMAETKDNFFMLVSRRGSQRE